MRPLLQGLSTLRKHVYLRNSTYYYRSDVPPDVVIPPKRNRKEQRSYDKELYKARHLIENFFCKLKQFRAIATRYDKTARNFLAAIYLAATTIWLI